MGGGALGGGFGRAGGAINGNGWGMMNGSLTGESNGLRGLRGSATSAGQSVKNAAQNAAQSAAQRKAAVEADAGSLADKGRNATAAAMGSVSGDASRVTQAATNVQQTAGNASPGACGERAQCLRGLAGSGFRRPASGYASGRRSATPGVVDRYCAG